MELIGCIAAVRALQFANCSSVQFSSVRVCCEHGLNNLALNSKPGGGADVRTRRSRWTYVHDGLCRSARSPRSLHSSLRTSFSVSQSQSLSGRVSFVETDLRRRAVYPDRGALGTTNRTAVHSRIYALTSWGTTASRALVRQRPSRLLSAFCEIASVNNRRLTTEQ